VHPLAAPRPPLLAGSRAASTDLGGSHAQARQRRAWPGGATPIAPDIEPVPAARRSPRRGRLSAQAAA
jgi:hypothetical protein